jgi:hypothetical protein
MKFQQSAEALLQRFGSATSHWDPNRLTELAPMVLPTLSIGSDRIDLERATFGVGVQRIAAAAQFPTVGLGWVPGVNAQPFPSWRFISAVLVCTLNSVCIAFSPSKFAAWNNLGVATVGPQLATGGPVSVVRDSIGFEMTAQSAISNTALSLGTAGFSLVANVPFVVPVPDICTEAVLFQAQQSASTLRGYFLYGHLAS